MGNTDSIEKAVLVVVLLILIAFLAPVALVGLFNTTAFNGVPAWVPNVLGTMGVVSFILVIVYAVVVRRN